MWLAVRARCAERHQRAERMRADQRVLDVEAVLAVMRRLIHRRSLVGTPRFALLSRCGQPPRSRRLRARRVERALAARQSTSAGPHPPAHLSGPAGARNRGKRRHDCEACRHSRLCHAVRGVGHLPRSCGARARSDRQPDAAPERGRADRPRRILRPLRPGGFRRRRGPLPRHGRKRGDPAGGHRTGSARCTPRIPGATRPTASTITSSPTSFRAAPAGGSGRCSRRRARSPIPASASSRARSTEKSSSPTSMTALRRRAPE